MTRREHAVDVLSSVRVAPSVLAADFAHLGAQVGEVLDAGARVIHVDVMDGHFVPPITMGPLVVAALAEQVRGAGAVLDVHLMIDSPERQIGDFAAAGADVITIHAEATPQVHRALHAVLQSGCAAGIAICPATPVRVITEVTADIDLLLVMTVDPGWGGQPFIAGSPGKIKRARALLGAGAPLEVDGGIDAASAIEAARAGASAFVAGSAIFAAGDPAAAYSEIAAAVEPDPADVVDR